MPRAHASARPTVPRWKRAKTVSSSPGARPGPSSVTVDPAGERRPPRSAARPGRRRSRSRSATSRIRSRSAVRAAHGRAVAASTTTDASRPPQRVAARRRGGAADRSAASGGRAVAGLAQHQQLGDHAREPVDLAQRAVDLLARRTVRAVAAASSSRSRSPVSGVRSWCDASATNVALRVDHPLHPPGHLVERAPELALLARALVRHAHAQVALAGAPRGRGQPAQRPHDRRREQRARGQAQARARSAADQHEPDASPSAPRAPTAATLWVTAPRRRRPAAHDRHRGGEDALDRASSLSRCSWTTSARAAPPRSPGRFEKSSPTSPGERCRRRTRPAPVRRSRPARALAPAAPRASAARSADAVDAATRRRRPRPARAPASRPRRSTRSRTRAHQRHEQRRRSPARARRRAPAAAAREGSGRPLRPAP